MGLVVKGLGSSEIITKGLGQVSVPVPPVEGGAADTRKRFRRPYIRDFYKEYEVVGVVETKFVLNVNVIGTVRSLKVLIFEIFGRSDTSLLLEVSCVGKKETEAVLEVSLGGILNKIFAVNIDTVGIRQFSEIWLFSGLIGFKEIRTKKLFNLTGQKFNVLNLTYTLGGNKRFVISLPKPIILRGFKEAETILDVAICGERDISKILEALAI